MISSLPSSTCNSQSRAAGWDPTSPPTRTRPPVKAPSRSETDHLASPDQVEFIGGRIVLRQKQLPNSTAARSATPSPTWDSPRRDIRPNSASPTGSNAPSLKTGAPSSDSVMIILEHPPHSSPGTSGPSDTFTTSNNPNMAPRQEVRRHQWPTSDQVKYNPLNHPDTVEYQQAVADGEITDVASNEADCGDGVVLRTNQQDNQNSDPPVNWDGTWAPPPVDWDERPLFVDAHVLDCIHEWQQRSTEAFEPLVVGNINEAPGEAAPRSWYRPALDGVAIESWWFDHNKDPDVFSDVAPWWHRYITPMPQAVHLTSLQHPEPRLDQSDNDMHKAMTGTSMQALLTWNNNQLRSREKAQAKMRRREHVPAARPVRGLVHFVPAKPVHPYAPRTNVYLRPAKENDVPQMAAIYNYWIKNGTICPEMDPLRDQEVRDRFRNSTEVKLPFLVAVSRSSKGNRRTAAENDHIVGFAFADDYNDVRGMYRYTVEVELFVDPEFLRKGIGRCLLDKTLCCLDPDYSSRGGYDFESDDMAYRGGGKRRLCSVILSMPYGKGDWEEIKWKFLWLQQFGFKRAGELAEIGRKNNTIVNLVLLQRLTTETITPFAI